MRSEHREVLCQNEFHTRSSDRGEWQSLRLCIARSVPGKLAVALIEVPKFGHPRLDPNIRGMQVEWWPQYHEGEERLHALTQALLGVTQTRS